MRPPIGVSIAHGLATVARVARETAEHDPEVVAGDPDNDQEHDPQAEHDFYRALQYIEELHRWYVDGQGI